MTHADLTLATRLERASAEGARACVRAHRRLFPQSAAETFDLLGGSATFIDEASPLTQVKGAGMAGLVAEADVDALEAFFEERMTPVSYVLCPFSDAALLTSLSRRGYELGAFENTLVRELGPEDAIEEADVREAEDADEWATVLAESFLGIVTASGIELGRTLHAMAGARNLIVRNGDVPAAGAQVVLFDGLATLQCDGTLPKYREVGLQKKLIRARLAIAARAGCDLATADTVPGSLSQRNYEKLGFHVAYTKLTLVKPC